MYDKDLVLNILGYFGAFLLALLNIPQVYYCYKHKTTKGLSTTFVCLGVSTSLVFTLYGIFLPSLHLIIANSMALISCSFLLYAKLFFKKNVTDKTAEVSSYQSPVNNNENNI